MQGDSQIVQQPQQLLLAGFIFDPLRNAEFSIVRKCLVVRILVFESRLHRKPTGGQRCLDVFELRHLLPNQLFRLRHSLACLARSPFDDAANGGVLMLEIAPVDLHRVLIAFIGDDDHRGIVRNVLDRLQPIVDPRVRFGVAGTDEQDVQTPLGEEELMRGMINVLPTEVPDIRADFPIPSCNRH